MTCYFGSRPWYFDYFAASCAGNPDIDFVVITDINFQEQLPGNIRIIPMSLSGIAQLAEQKLSFPVRLDYAYKLCDFKPAYGYLFSELLDGYDFWGHADIDLIYGNIRNFVSDSMLAEFDIISARHEYIAGFFTLFRNTARINEIFRKSRDYQKVFQDPRYCCFDENNWQWRELIEGQNIFLLKNEIHSMTYIVRQEDFCRGLKAHFGLAVNEDGQGNIAWREGRLYHGETEILLYHLIFFKTLDFHIKPLWQTIPHSYYFSGFSITLSRPGTLRALAGRLIAQIRRGVHRATGQTVQLATWFFNYTRSTRHIRTEEFPGYHEISGRYELWQGDTYLDILERGGRLYGRSDDASTLLLKHMQRKRFIAGKFRLGTLRNVEVEFGYDDHQALQTIKLHSFPGKVSTLFKKTTVSSA